MAEPIGIDLGTTYTVVATVKGGRPTVIPNDEGEPLTPSVVTFVGDDPPLVGRAALELASDPRATVVSSVKRWMGSGQTFPVGSRRYTPVEVSALVLRKVAGDAERYLGRPVTQAVVTVPAYFNDRQRRATREAAGQAGLEVLHLLSEPTAAALAYGLHREDIHTVLVWDLGGGTFDVSILALGEGVFEVLAVAGDNWLGGDDLDARLVAHLQEAYHSKAGEAPGASEHALRRLAEEARIRLSTSLHTRVSLPGPPPIELEVTRQLLEELNQDLWDRMRVPALQVLADAGLGPAEIDRVILVGGATRTPAVRRLVQELIGKAPYRLIDPNQVVACGAAVDAAMALGMLERVTLLDVLPLSLGVETHGGVMAAIIPRNTPVPASGTRIVTTAADGQTSMDIHALQGERAMAVDNVSLGRFELTGIPRAPRAVPKVEVAFQVDVDGIVRVSAQDLWNEREVTVQLVSSKLLDPHEVVQRVADAAASAEEDRSQRDAVRGRVEAEGLLAAAQAVLDERRRTDGSDAGRPLGDAVQGLRLALDQGATEEFGRRCGELRALLERLSTGSEAR